MLFRSRRARRPPLRWTDTGGVGATDPIEGQDAAGVEVLVDAGVDGVLALLDESDDDAVLDDVDELDALLDDELPGLRLSVL